MKTTIGDQVRTYRLRRGLTQARLAHLIGRSERWLNDVEHGGVDPRLSDAVALARMLRVGVDDLARDLIAVMEGPVRQGLPGRMDRRRG
jgi:transcriptional regulator with XRE-family HTH domain